MGYGMKNMACNYRNAVSSFLQSQNWSDVAKKIADKELDKNYMVERFSGLGVTNEDMEFAISKLTQEKKNITGLTRKGRVQYVIDKVKEKLNKNKASGSEGGLVKTIPSSTAPIGITSPGLDITSWFEKFKIGGGADEQSTSETIQVKGEDEDKPKTNWLLIGGIGAGVVTLGVIGYFVFRNKN